MIFELLINGILIHQQPAISSGGQPSQLPCRIGGFGTWKIRCAAGIHAVVPGEQKCPFLLAVPWLRSGITTKKKSKINF